MKLFEHRKVWRLWIIAALAGLLGGWSARASATPVKAKNVVLISMDTCRADRLSCYGFPKPTTPNIDALAKHAIRFEHVITPTPNTLPAHCSMLTGTNPPFHGVHANNNYRLPKSNETLAEILGRNGFKTGAFISAFVLDSQFGLDQGFDTYDDDLSAESGPRGMTRRTAEGVNQRAFAWLDQHAAKPFFVLLHYYDAHAPYTSPEPFKSRFADDPYAGAVAYVDHHVGKLLDKLKAIGVYDSTLVIVTADHGEGLSEHGERWHGFFIYHDTTRVPLIIKPAGSTKAAVVKEPAGLIDIVPTVLAAVGLSSDQTIHGLDLSPFWSGGRRAPSERFMFSESIVPTLHNCSALFALEDGDWKYIHATRPELYNLARDPKEKTNLVEKEKARARLLEQRLRSVLAAETRTKDEEARVVLDAESQAKLQSLGYVGGHMESSIEFDKYDCDPKDFVEVYELLVQALDAEMRADAASVERVCKKILEIRPDIATAHEMLGAVTPPTDLETRKYHFFEALKYDPNSAEAYFGLGNVFARKHQLANAETYFREAVRLAENPGASVGQLKWSLIRMGKVSPILFKARLHLADTLMVMRRFDEAIDMYYEALMLEPLISDSDTFRQIKAGAYVRLGDLLRIRARFEDAVNAYQSALALKPDLPSAERGLDIALDAAQRQAERQKK